MYNSLNQTVQKHTVLHSHDYTSQYGLIEVWKSVPIFDIQSSSNSSSGMNCENSLACEILKNMIYIQFLETQFVYSSVRLLAIALIAILLY